MKNGCGSRMETISDEDRAFIEKWGFYPRLLGPQALVEGRYVELSFVHIAKDNIHAGRVKLFRACEDVLDQAYKLGLPMKGLTRVFQGLIEGWGLSEHGLGEFIKRWERFERAFETPDVSGVQREQETWMQPRVSGEHEWRIYRREGHENRRVPLPLFVRNVATHRGSNPLNTLVPDDVDVANQMLDRWLKELSEVDRARP